MRKSFTLLVLLLGLAACLSGCSSSERPATSANPTAAPNNTTGSNANAPASAAPNSQTVGSGGASANRPDSHKPSPAGIKPPQKAN
jgi:PBP1b-binding outer membrane lipoprotein LpoB